ncbi:MAG: hypothetical protein LBM92_04090, partial [Opitutaceae bacterium]|nr:hypothetical protein [Opitutaceae bacterium]
MIPATCLNTSTTGPKAPSNHPEKEPPRLKNTAATKSLMLGSGVLKMILLFCCLIYAPIGAWAQTAEELYEKGVDLAKQE